MADRLRRWPVLVLSGALGVVAGLGQVPFSLVPLALAALAGICWLVIGARDWRGGVLRGWIAGAGYFAVTLHWIVEPFLVDVPRHGWMAPFALLFSAFGFALFWALGAGLAHAFAPAGCRRGVAWALAMTLGELLRGYILTGFPWAMLGYVWSEGPAAQIVAVTGPYGLTLLTLLGCAGAALLVRQPDMRRLARVGVAVLAVWGGLSGLGALLLVPQTELPGDGPVIRLVQPNAPQHLKWDPEFAQMFFARQLEYTAAPPQLHRPPDLTVWPETATSYAIEPGHPALAHISAAAAGRAVALGAQRFEGARAFNSLVVLGQGGQIETVYDKHHLVPLGEYIPFGQLARAIGLRSFAARDGFGFSPGPGPRLIDLGVFGQALPLICYEAVFPHDLRGTARPGWLLQVTNDAWFGTFAGPQQHLAQARLRAIEQGLPMIRVANTGISAVIDAQGRMLRHLPLGEAGFFDTTLPPLRIDTQYRRTGDLPMVVLLLLLSGGLILLRWRKGD